MRFEDLQNKLTSLGNQQCHAFTFTSMILVYTRTAVLAYLLHTVGIIYAYVDLLCFVPLFYFICNLFHITMRQSYMKTMGLDATLWEQWTL